MKLLLDTHMLLAIGQGSLKSRYPKHAQAAESYSGRLFGSAASLWEMNIKIGIGKLDLGMPAKQFSDYLQSLGIHWLTVSIAHATAILDVPPTTRDPFDRILLAQCQVDGMKLITADKLLADHPLAFNI